MRPASPAPPSGLRDAPQPGRGPPPLAWSFRRTPNYTTYEAGDVVAGFDNIFPPLVVVAVVAMLVRAGADPARMQRAVCTVTVLAMAVNALIAVSAADGVENDLLARFRLFGEEESVADCAAANVAAWFTANAYLDQRAGQRFAMRLLPGGGDRPTQPLHRRRVGGSPACSRPWTSLSPASGISTGMLNCSISR